MGAASIAIRLTSYSGFRFSDNARPNTDRVARNDSPIIGLKTFNNWIKSVLIAKFGRREGDKVSPKLKVLDLGCGKGGDLQKWAKAGTDEYIGLDLAEVSVEQARSRWEQMRGNNKFQAAFFAHDCFGVCTCESQSTTSTPRSLTFCQLRPQ